MNWFIRRASTAQPSTETKNEEHNPVQERPSLSGEGNKTTYVAQASEAKLEPNPAAPAPPLPQDGSVPRAAAVSQNERQRSGSHDFSLVPSRGIPSQGSDEDLHVHAVRSNKRVAEDTHMPDVPAEGSPPPSKRIGNLESQKTKQIRQRTVDTDSSTLNDIASDPGGGDDHGRGGELLRELDTRPITIPQLIQEIKGIYAGLVMVEKKCIEIVQQQQQSTTKLTNEQWQALIALHRTLLNEHHDFFAAAYHPSTKGHELRKLAANYAMPARMWRHGIHAFLELLRHRLPDSLDHMLSFCYLAYSMVALLKETIDGFEETWIECLGDLARYRMAIEEADLRDREIWSNTARRWYDKAADLSPYTGRIQHHLAVLARPNIMQQQFLYTKSLVSAIPFKNAADSIMLLYDPLIKRNTMMHPRYPLAEAGFITACAILFTRGELKEFNSHYGDFSSCFDSHLARTGSKFKVQGPEMAASIFAVMFGFGNSENPIWKKVYDHQDVTLLDAHCAKVGKTRKELPKDYVVDDPELINAAFQAYWSKPIQQCNIVPAINLEEDRKIASSLEVSSVARHMAINVISIVAGRIGDKNVVGFMHMVLAIVWGLARIPGALVAIEACLPWAKIVQFLNTVGRSGTLPENYESESFPRSCGGSGQQLPEDFVMRGLLPLVYYFPKMWFVENVVDEDERLLELASHQSPRVERCLWCGVRLASLNRWITYDSTSKDFAVTQFAESLTSA